MPSGRGKRRRFRAEVLTGHKGAAVIVPFDPKEAWGIRPVLVASKAYGKRPGHPVRATLNGHPFDGWIGHRWGRFFILVDEELQEAAGVAVGDVVGVTVEPGAPVGKITPAKRPAKKPAKKRARS